MNTYRLNVGVIGLGVGEQHLIAYQNHPDCVVKAVCDFDYEIQKRFSVDCPNIKFVKNPDEILCDSSIDVVTIASWDNYHYEQIVKGLEHGKHIFVEKPICLTSNELNSIKDNYKFNKILMVGYNRRFSPFIEELKYHLDQSNAPKAFIYICNAGKLESNHWLHNNNIGGGRLIGEACHFVDLIRYLVGYKIEDLSITYAKDFKQNPDTFNIQMKFIDGSIGIVHYFANGNKAIPKERIEVYSSGNIFKLDNYLTLKAWGKIKIKNKRKIKQEKGQVECINKFLNAIRNGGPNPIPIDEIFEVQEKLLSALNK